MIKPVFKATLLVLWIGISYCIIYVAKKTGHKERYNRAIMLCHQGMLTVCGIRLTVNGTPYTKRPLLVVSNHISYLDIAVLGSQMPVRFTPKSEIAQWPVIGAACRICDSVFIDRKRSMIKPMKEAVQNALKDGKVISVFPEATTGDGIHLEPFKPGFFDLAEEDYGEDRLTIQPVAITYTKIRKLPIDRTQWPDIAWYGDMEFAPHLFNVLSLGPIDAEIVFLPPIEVDRNDTSKAHDRKSLAAECQLAIEQAIDDVRSRAASLTPHKANIKNAPALKIQQK